MKVRDDDTGRSGPQRVSMPPLALAVAAIALCMGGCGSRRLNVVQTPEQTLMAIGYSADRSQSIFRANDDAQSYCERQESGVVFLAQETVYQGQYPEDITAGARAAGRVADALGSQQTAGASRALSSPTDYKTTFEFLCR